ncbi:MAG TPA: glycosyltransferase family 4 protein [Chloroflexia bacterium]|nr:glycosyltransferase family 4 protein [Chloroflexia bacterium]
MPPLPGKSRGKERPRILFVCFADSTHSQSWMSLLEGSEFEVRVFSYSVGDGDRYPPLPWRFPTYTVTCRDTRAHKTAQAFWLLPNARWMRYPVNWITYRLRLQARWLRWVIRTWKPHIVHSLSIDLAGIITGQALDNLPRAMRPEWVVSSWGSDINMGIHHPDSQSRIQHVLRNCDGYIADCRRDIRQALANGLSSNKVAIDAAIPGTGGLDLDKIPAGEPCESRNLIVIPKAYEEHVNKTLPILEALHSIEDVLGGYEIHLFMCSKEIQTWLNTLPESLRQRCHCHGTVPREELFGVLRRARVMIATSLSDGTPSTMLEAMATGALPLMSPLESIQEWIQDSDNGLLAHALYPDQIAVALRRALADDELCERAARINRQILAERANRGLIRLRVLDYYRSLLCPGAPGV